MPAQGQISENSRRIAKNTLFLYFRMFLMMVIGLFTSRVVLKALGVDDVGVYNAVGGAVSLFAVVSNSVAAAVTRFITCELGRKDFTRLRRVFSTSVVVMLIFCGVLLVFVETFGLWYLNCRMNIPEGRLGAANWVLQCSMLTLMASLLSVPYNATIMAHERMKIYAYISILEAVLKLSVALLLALSVFDKLITYAVLMVVVFVVIRFVYGLYCHKNFEETRSGFVFDRGLIREMLGFAGWNSLASGTYVVNTQGVNLLVNHFFGVALNAARHYTTQVDGIVKQFVTNVVVSINPQITKSYVTGNKDYSFELVRKACKYTYLIILVFAVPVFFEAESLLRLWLGTVPEWTALFTKLTLVCLVLDVICTPFSTLILADGKIRDFYLWSSCVTILMFPVTWVVYHLGAPAYASYLVFVGVYLVADAVKLVVLNRKTCFPIGAFVREVLLRVLPPTVFSAAAAWAAFALIPEGLARLAAVLVASTIAMAAAVFVFSLTPGERSFVISKLRRHDVS